MSSNLDLIHADNKRTILSLLCVDDHQLVDIMLRKYEEDVDLVCAHLIEMGYGPFEIKYDYIHVHKELAGEFLQHVVNTTRSKTPLIDPEAFLCLELNTSSGVLTISGVHSRQIELASEQVKQHIARMRMALSAAPVSSALTLARPPAAAKTLRHIFVDNSNLFLGRPQRFDRMRINVPELTRILTKGVAGVRIMAGSDDLGPRCRWVEQWSGYKTQIAQKTAKGAETMVDEFLHAQIYNCCLSNLADARNTTIVLVTGDGNGNGGFSNFPTVIEQLKGHGFRFEVWAWRSSFSDKLRRCCDACFLLDDVAGRIFA